MVANDATLLEIMERIIKDDVCIAAAKAKRVDGYPSQSVTWPCNCLRGDLHAQFCQLMGLLHGAVMTSKEQLMTYCSVVKLEVNVGIDLFKECVRGDDALLKGHCTERKLVQ